MKVHATGVLPISKIEMSLPGVRHEMYQHVDPHFCIPDGDRDLDTLSSMRIEFADTMEIDLLIHVLTRFKRENEHLFGEYRNGMKGGKYEIDK